MQVYISVVSHHHYNIIESLDCLNKLAKSFHVIVKSNIPDIQLKHYCLNNDLVYLENINKKGFGENNNDNFEYCIKELDMQPDDLFIILNPDIIISENSIFELIKVMTDRNIEFATINLYRDKEHTEFDPSIRKFPTLIDFVSSYIGFGNKTIIDKTKILDVCDVDWSAGSFLALRVKLYETVGGFSRRYFMYCEDIDICMRLGYEGYQLFYIPYIKATHLARQNNRKIMSKHFFWHLKSMLMYLWEKRKYATKKSINNNYKVY